MTIIFPMAGLSSRFVKVGYNKPKYMLPLKEHTVFYEAVYGFKNYFNSCKILFICRDIQDTEIFIKNQCQYMGLENYDIVILKSETEGQAHTVSLGLEIAKIDNNEEILIFNIDTFRPNFLLPKELDFSTIDGYLEVFEAKGEHWSFVLPESKNSNRVIKTAEKERISSLCSSGLYYFKMASEFQRIFNKMIEKSDKIKNEFYIAPMYNYLINEGKDIRYSKISLDEIIFCGTPDEYERLLKYEY